MLSSPFFLFITACHVLENNSAQGLLGVHKPFCGTADAQPSDNLRGDFLFQRGTIDCADARSERLTKGFKLELRHTDMGALSPTPCGMTVQNLSSFKFCYKVHRRNLKKTWYMLDKATTRKGRDKTSRNVATLSSLPHLFPQTLVQSSEGVAPKTNAIRLSLGFKR